MAGKRHAKLHQGEGFSKTNEVDCPCIHWKTRCWCTPTLSPGAPHECGLPCCAMRKFLMFFTRNNMSWCLWSGFFHRDNAHSLHQNSWPTKSPQLVPIPCNPFFLPLLTFSSSPCWRGSLWVWSCPWTSSRWSERGSSRHWPKMTPSGLSTEDQSIAKKVVMLLVDLSKKVWKHNFLITVTFFVLFAYCTLSLYSLCIIPYLILYGGSSLGSVNLLSWLKFARFQLFIHIYYVFLYYKYFVFIIPFFNYFPFIVSLCWPTFVICFTRLLIIMRNPSCECPFNCAHMKLNQRALCVQILKIGLISYRTLV